MAKLRHLAILTHQPDRLADFYKRVFEMQELYRTKNGSVHLSDGEINLAILNATDPKEPEHTLVSITLASMWKIARGRRSPGCPRPGARRRGGPARRVRAASRPCGSRRASRPSCASAAGGCPAPRAARRRAPRRGPCRAAPIRRRSR